MKLFLTIRLNSIIFISMMLQICVTPGFSQWKIVEGYSICYEFSPIVVMVSGNTEKVSLRGVSFDTLRHLLPKSVFQACNPLWYQWRLFRREILS
jgi:hypothetical protein